MQKLVRAALGTNNVDTCARVCHSPTGYGLKSTLGESAGTQAFDSVDEGGRDRGDRRQPDRRASGLRLADEAAPAPGRQADRRRSARDRPGACAAHRGRRTTCSCVPGTNVGVHQCAGARRRHRGAHRRRLRRGALRGRVLPALEGVRRRGQRNSPEATEAITGVPAERWCARRPRLYAGGPTARSTTASASPSTARARPWSWASRTSRWRPATSVARASASVRCAARTTCRARATWDRSRTSSAATATCRTTRSRGLFEDAWSVTCWRRAGPAHSEHVRSRARRQLQGPVRPGRGLRPVRSEHAARRRGADAPWNASSCRTCS